MSACKTVPVVSLLTVWLDDAEASGNFYAVKVTKKMHNYIVDQIILLRSKRSLEPYDP